MGLFALSDKELGTETVEELVETALANIELWRENPDCEYLLECFAVGNLARAARVIRADAGRETEADKELRLEDDEMQERIDAQILDAHQSSND